MPDSLRAHVRSGLSLLLLVIHTVFWATPLYGCAILRILVPWKPWQRLCSWVEQSQTKWMAGISS